MFMSFYSENNATHHLTIHVDVFWFFYFV